MNKARVSDGVFKRVLDYPKTVVFLSLVYIVCVAAGAKSLIKDTSLDAFIDPNHPVLVYRDKVKETFGLDDPIVVALINNHGSVYNPRSLNLLYTLSRELESIKGVDPDGITSLATQRTILGDHQQIDSPYFLDGPIATQADADAVRARVESFPIVGGNLVSHDNRGVLLVVQLLDDADGNAVYHAIRERIEIKVNASPEGQGHEVYVAGEAAVQGYLAHYIDKDARKLNPISGLIILLVLFIAYRSWQGMLFPLVIVIATALTAVGLMGFWGVRFYPITNALTVILIGIAVADSIHILGEYDEQKQLDPGIDRRELGLRAMAEMWRPVSLTTLTTIAGFSGLAIASIMPPMQYFGLFAVLGIIAAWLFSLFTLPALLFLFPQKCRAQKDANNARLRRSIAAYLGRIIVKRAALIVVLGVGLTLGAGLLASKLTVDDIRINNFKEHEPIYVADRKINGRFNGSNYIDIVVTTPEEEGAFSPEVLKQVEALQQYAETLPHVNSSVSVVDYIKQMNKAVNGGAEAFYVLPDRSDQIAQYFLLYSSSGNSDDFQEEIDYAYQTINVRITLDTDQYSVIKQVIPALESYLPDHFQEPGVSANLAGRLCINYFLLSELKETHFQGVFLALLMVMLMAIVTFRSITLGLLCVVPVCISVLCMYAFMAVFDIWLALGTTMYAAISIGLGVDFSIHTMDKIRQQIASGKGDMSEILTDYFRTTGRALMFNLIALGVGFGIVMLSELNTLIRLGGLVSIGLLISFISSITFLPALLLMIKPKALFCSSEKSNTLGKALPNSVVGIVVVLSLLTISTASRPLHALESDLARGLQAVKGMDARTLVEKVNSRDEGVVYFSSLEMRLYDKRNKMRTRKATSVRKYIQDEKRTLIFFEKPNSVKKTAFLTIDYENQEDDQWLYLPSIRKVRRIASSNRGDSFMGSDFSYEDIKKQNKINAVDYDFELKGEKLLNGESLLLLSQIPKSDSVARELGYGKVLSYISSKYWLPVKIDFWDVAGNFLKTIEVNEIEEIQGIVTVKSFVSSNHKTGHKTEFIFSDIDYQKDLEDSVFTQERLRRGL